MGESWEYSCAVAEDEEASFNETSLYETPNGDLLAFVRTVEDDVLLFSGLTDGDGHGGNWARQSPRSQEGGSGHATYKLSSIHLLVSSA